MEMDAWVNGRVGGVALHAEADEEKQETAEDVHAVVAPASRHRRSMDIMDLVDELPSLSALKDKQWMKKFAPRNMFAQSPSPAKESGIAEGGNGDESVSASANGMGVESPAQSSRTVMHAQYFVFPPLLRFPRPQWRYDVCVR